MLPIYCQRVLYGRKAGLCLDRYLTTSGDELKLLMQRRHEQFDAWLKLGLSRTELLLVELASEASLNELKALTRALEFLAQVNGRKNRRHWARQSLRCYERSERFHRDYRDARLLLDPLLSQRLLMAS